MNKYQAAFIPAGLLVLALLQLPYGYYQFLRVVVTAWALFIAWSEYQRVGSVNGWVIGFGLAAVFFNPLAPIHLRGSTWALWDVVFAALFGAHGGLRIAKGEMAADSALRESSQKE